MTLPVALTMGEPAGIGGEIAFKVWRETHAIEDTPSYFLIDDVDRLKRLAHVLKFDIPLVEVTDPASAMDVFSSALPVLHCPLVKESVPGTLDPENASTVLASIRMAVSLVSRKQASAVVTNPIHKKCLYDAGFEFPGHTEYLAELAEIETPPVMMLRSPKLSVVPVTIHVGLQHALDTLTTNEIVEISRITEQALKRDFGIDKPRLAIAGLNPHAGEEGKMGTEERTLIDPAVATLQSQGIDASGPWPPDTMFHDAARERYDAAICMYHDQALIPIKTLDFEGAVNVTLGLPFVRTSPDHGTALDLAGTGKASATSLLAAINMAHDMAGRRRQNGSS